MGIDNTEPRERPLLLKGELVRAILDGRKTVTRRPIQPRWGTDHPHPRELLAKPSGGDYPTVIEPTGYEPGAFRMMTRGSHGGWIIRCPLGGPGDRLWVRENWVVPGAVPGSDDPVRPGMRVLYPADGGCDGYRKRPSLHMPRWACRLVLEITEVRAERLQDITEADARAEGAVDMGIAEDRAKRLLVDPVSQFRHLWNGIYGKRKGLAWADHPWVWRIAFQALEARQ